MSIKSPVLTTTTSLTAMANAFIGSASSSFGRGIAIGLNTRTQEVEYFNPWAMKEAGILESMFGLWLGKIMIGKSMAMKVCAIRLMMLSAGYDTMRTVINDYKPEGGTDEGSNGSEYGRFSQVAQSTVFRIANMQINPLEERMFASRGEGAYELGILSMAKSIIEFGKGSKLIGHEDTSLRVAVSVMLSHNPTLWGLGLLAKLLRSITREQIEAYYKGLDSKLQAQLEYRIDVLHTLGSTGDANLDVRKNLKAAVVSELTQLVNAKDNLSLQLIQSSGDRVAAYLEGIIHGSFGKMLGDKHSLYDISTQRAVTKDWRGVGPEDETLMRIIDTRFMTSAVENHQLDLLPHLMLDDEMHKPLSNETYAEGRQFFGEIARGLHMCMMSASHRLDSLRKGGEGSNLYHRGEAIINNMGWFGVGRQVNNPRQLKELQERLACTNAERDGLARLPKRVFALKFGEAEPVRHVQIVATPLEIAMGKSEGAVERMMDQPDINKPGDLRRFAERNNLKLAQPRESAVTLQKESVEV